MTPSAARLLGLVLCAGLLGLGLVAEELRLSSPANRLVFQRDGQGQGVIPLAGTGAPPHARVRVRLRLAGSAATPKRWRTVGRADALGNFRTPFTAAAGWYELEVETRGRRGHVSAARVNRVGVGEVFVIVGHSVAQGGELNLPGATSDQVNTVALDETAPDFQQYLRTGAPELLPPLVGRQFGDGVCPAPFGHGTYFWAQFGDEVARRQQVPVMIFNAAFGGTTLEHWARSARGEMFEHSFVRAALRMPYLNLAHTLSRYGSVTGVRAILADQGQNDAGQTNAAVIFENYRAWIQQARRDFGSPGLAVVVNRQTPYRERTAVRQAQERVIREVSTCFTGPDYDRLAETDRYDRIHLSETGMARAAELWAEALGPVFWKRARPILAGQR